ncbi:MAG: ABC transporter permease [Candidatus Sumerlaeia bacterium]|nr:ABC transporter permease [Candidatus Sumerlaeia bacterium]
MINGIERRFERIFETSGGMGLLLVSALRHTAFGRQDRRRLLQQMLVVGYQTVPLALLIGAFVGMTLALNTGLALQTYGQTVLIAQVVALSLMREMGPVITAVIITGRVGAAMTAELGTMAVNDEIDVLRVLGIRPERYLVMPRILAALLMTPILTIYSVIIGFVGGMIIATNYFNVTSKIYWIKTFDALSLEEVYKGFFKSVVFGLTYATVCCYMGVTTRGGAEGVGRATTAAVVTSLSGVLVANFLLTRFLFG